MTTAPAARRPLLRALREDASGQAAATGVSAALLGYASSVAVVVAGLTAVGATPGQVSSALLALGVLMAVTTVLLSASTRMPVAVVWSTPAAALLATLGPVEGGFGAVVGAFALAGALVVLTGLVPPLARLLARIPPAVTAALLAGVLLPFCLAPARSAVDLPLETAALALTWLVASRWWPSWAAPAALAALVAVVLVDGGIDLPPSVLAAGDAVAPELSWPAVVSIALPVYLVTMAAQNLVGVSVLRTYGYAPPVGRLLVGTGAATVAGAPFGALPQNLAAITGALTAGPTAHADPARRWVCAVASGLAYLVLAALAPVTAAVVTQVDPRLVAAAAGLALLGAFAGAASGALRDDATRTAAVVTLVVTASGVSAAGLGPAPLGLLAGGAVLLLDRLPGGRRGATGGQADVRRRLPTAGRSGRHRRSAQQPRHTPAP